MSAAAASEAQLRELVREVLREVVPTLLAEARNGSARPPEAVELATDADVARFVGRLLSMAEDPAVRAELRAGHRTFRLAGPDTTPTPAGGAVSDPPLRLGPGAVTERRITVAATAGARAVLLGPGAVLTPLAREKARTLGLTVTRES